MKKGLRHSCDQDDNEICFHGKNRFPDEEGIKTAVSIHVHIAYIGRIDALIKKGLSH